MKKRMTKLHGLLFIFAFVVIASCSDEGQEQICGSYFTVNFI